MDILAEPDRSVGSICRPSSPDPLAVVTFLSVVPSSLWGRIKPIRSKRFMPPSRRHVMNTQAIGQTIAAPRPGRSD